MPTPTPLDLLLLIQFDNNGAITIATDDYTHVYDDPIQAAHDYKLLADGGDTSDWDGNEDEDVSIRPHPECPVLDHDEIQAIVKSGEHECNGYGETAFFRALGVVVNGGEE